MAKEKHTCETCAYENDSSTEHCGCCNITASNWTEAGWHIEKRLRVEIEQLQEENARHSQYIEFLLTYRTCSNDVIRERNKEIQQLQIKLADAQEENAKLKIENEGLKERLRDIEISET